jgi:hypothetical protein
MMSEKEFTPTWEEVRGAYVAYNSNRDGVSGVEAKAEFSRYWGEQIQRGREAERERLIKKLQDYVLTFYELSPTDYATHFPIESCVELLKREN